MTYYGAKEMAAAYRTVRKNTITIAEEIPEDQFGFRATPDTKTVAETLVHIALASEFQNQIHGVEKRTTLEGFDFPALMGKLTAEAAKPRTKAEILALLRGEGENFATWLESLSDEFLGESVLFPAGMQPASKSRFEMLLGVKEHEMHHRGQLMLVQRLLGITPHLTREMQARMQAMQAAAASKA